MILTQCKPGGDTTGLPVAVLRLDLSGSLGPVHGGRVGVGRSCPILIVTFWLQKHLVRGMTFGAVR